MLSTREHRTSSVPSWSSSVSASLLSTLGRIFTGTLGNGNADNQAIKAYSTIGGMQKSVLHGSQHACRFSRRSNRVAVPSVG